MGGGRGFGGRGGAAVGENPPSGAVINYWLKNRPQGEVTLEFLDSTGSLVKKFSSKADAAPAGRPPKPIAEENPFRVAPARSESPRSRA